MPELLAGLDIGDELTWEPARIVPPDPWTGHLAFAFWLVKAMRPTTLVELGTHSGNSYFAFCQAMAAFVPSGRAYAVDTWVGDEHAGQYGEDVFAGVANFNNEHFRPFSTLLRGTFDEARPYFPDGEIDLLHIDGMHTYEAVRRDFETWHSALSPRAVVLFHDTNVRERGFGVWRLWRELRERFPGFEFDHSHGLGVLGVGPEQPAAMQALFALPGDAAGKFRRLIAARGEAFQRQVQVLNLRTELQSAAAYAENLVGQINAHAAAAAGQPNEQAALREALAWRESLLQARAEVIAAKQAIIDGLHNTLASRAEALAFRDHIIGTKDAHAAQLQRDVREKTRLIGEEQRVRAEMQAGYEEAIAGITHDREHLARTAERAQQDAAHSAHMVQSLISSTSWKLTRPLRAAVRLATGRGLRPVPPALPAPPPAALPAPAAAVEAPPAADDVMATSALKRAMRDVLMARLQAFLASPGMLTLPRAERPDVTVLLVLFNQAELTFACLESIVQTLAAAAFGVEVVIADNGSTDDTGALLDRLEGATILRNAGNLHFLRAVNLAAQSARGRAILLLNNDAQLLPGAVASALRTLDSEPSIGAVGGRIILPDGTLQEAGSIIWRDGACSGYGRGQDPSSVDVMFQRDVDFCSGAFLLTPLALFRELSGFDEQFAPAYYEETDYCVRLWQSGRRVVYDPDAAIIHYEFGSSTRNGDALRLQAEHHAIFTAKHRAWLDGQYPASPLNVLAARSHGEAPRILVLEDRVPKVELGTGYPRSNRMLHEFAAAGAEVTLFPMFEHKETWHGVRRALDKRIEVLVGGNATQLRDFLAARPQQFDAILVCRPHNMESFLEQIGPERDLLGGAAVLYDAEALFVTRTLQRRAADGVPANDTERRKLLAAEVGLTRLADAVISVAPDEQDLLEEYGARNVHLLGHAMDEPPLATGFDERDQIVFLGAIQEEAAPNAEAVRWFAGSILPLLRETLQRPELRLTVVGLNKAASIAAMDGDQLDLLGMVDELPPALARARVMVVPSRLAAGIPLKAYQAAMLGIPMVATGLIARQLGWSDERELLVADDPGAFALACARLYGDPALWDTIRGNALRRVRQDCAPAAFAAKVREIVAGLPIVHRRPEGRPPPAAAPAGGADPPTSRPAARDWSAAVPFGYVPTPTEPRIGPRIGVMCHLFHPGVAKEVLFYCRNLPAPADLLISTELGRETGGAAAGVRAMGQRRARDPRGAEPRARHRAEAGGLRRRLRPLRPRAAPAFEDVGPRAVPGAVAVVPVRDLAGLAGDRPQHLGRLRPATGPRHGRAAALRGGPALARLERQLSGRPGARSPDGDRTALAPGAGFPVGVDVLEPAGRAASVARPQSRLRRFPRRRGAVGPYPGACHRAAVLS